MPPTPLLVDSHSLQSQVQRFYMRSTRWLSYGRVFAGALLSRWLAVLKLMAPAVARHEQLERL